MRVRTTSRLVAGAVAGAMLLTACADDTDTDPATEETTPEDAAETESPAADSESEPADSETAADATGVDALPDELQAEYVEIADARTQSSAYVDFEAVEGPWDVCYSESFMGNAWRVALADEMERLATEYEEAGLVSSYTVSVAEGDVAQQNQHIRQFTEQGCDVIYIVPGSTTALNDAIEAAYDAGIPVVSITESASPHAQVVDSNYYVLGANLARHIAENNEGGDVLMIKGIEGTPVASAQNEGAEAVWEETSTSVAARVNGDWTPSVTKQVTLNTLTTNPGEVTSVWSTGSETAVIAEAFDEAGRDAPLITGSISGDALGYWNENPDKFNFHGVALMPSWTAQTGFRVGMRLLDGQKPTMQTIMVPVPEVTADDLEVMHEPCMTPDATSIFPVTPEDPLPPTLMDAYFTGDGEVGPFDYANTPSPCA